MEDGGWKTVAWLRNPELREYKRNVTGMKGVKLGTELQEKEKRGGTKRKFTQRKMSIKTYNEYTHRIAIGKEKEWNTMHKQRRKGTSIGMKEQRYVVFSEVRLSKRKWICEH